MERTAWMFSALAAVLAGCAPASGGGSAPAPHTRTYYVAADTVDWDYAPGGDTNLITGEPYDSVARLFVASGPTDIGRVYRKAVYREYTDSTFTTLKPRDPAWEHLGILGPLLRAVVGDTIRVVFRNNVSFPASVHPHGVFYDKSSEGAPYADSTSGNDKADDGVPTGGTHVYVWPVPERAGPGPGDPSSVMWMYHSHVNDERDVDAGLVGPIIVTARASARADGTPNDVDRELVVAFDEFDENQSWYLADNVRKYIKDPAKVKFVTITVRGDEPDPGLWRELHGRHERICLRPHAGPHHEGGPAGALVPDGDDRIRVPFPALAREHRPHAPDADRRRGPAAHGHGDGRHGARRSGNLAVPLPRRPAPDCRDAGTLPRGAVTGGQADGQTGRRAAMSEVPTRLTAALADRYVIERELGQGGMATVYLARDLKHDRQVAIKVLRPELAATLGSDRFLSEIRTTAKLSHPHILALHDSGVAEGFLFYVMPLVEGETLRARMTREKTLPIGDAVRLAREVADALAYAHAHGVIHRDIKPENILLQSGHAIVADFGIARAVTAAGSERITMTGMAVGTPAYMSPEQAAGERDVDGRSDLYALASVLYEMLAGEPPFTGPSIDAVLVQRFTRPRPGWAPSAPTCPGPSKQPCLPPWRGRRRIGSPRWSNSPRRWSRRRAARAPSRWTGRSPSSRSPT